MLLSIKRGFRAAYVPGLLVAALLVSTASGAGTFRVIYNFSQYGGKDGSGPIGGLTIDSAGNLYGTTSSGGANDFGAVFELTPQPDGSWNEQVIYSFAAGSDGIQPTGNLILDAQGNLYGTTVGGGNGACGFAYTNGCGTVFKLTPSAGGWTETVLYRFGDYSIDGVNPTGGLAFDHAGNLYGVAEYGGGGAGCSYGCGTVFQLTPNADGTWAEHLLHIFVGNSGDGAFPQGALVFDKTGNLYGTAQSFGTYNCGMVFELATTKTGWNEKVLYDFGQSSSDGCFPTTGVIIDSYGHLFGNTLDGGSWGAKDGTVFELVHTPPTWTESVLYSFGANSTDGLLPATGLALDSAHHLWGITDSGGNPCFHGTGCGTVFELKHSGASWLETIKRRFHGSDGYFPQGGSLTIDGAGNVFGTAMWGGNGGGTVFEITP